MVKAMRANRSRQLTALRCIRLKKASASWLAFLSGQHDYLPILPASVSNVAKSEGKLKPEYASRAFRCSAHETERLVHDVQHERPDYRWLHPGEDRAATRDLTGVPARRADPRGVPGRRAGWQGIVPPGVVGHDDKRPRAHVTSDPALAKALLDRFGYKGPRWRRLSRNAGRLAADHPYVARTSGIERQLAELWKKSMDAIGIPPCHRNDEDTRHAQGSATGSGQDDARRLERRLP